MLSSQDILGRRIDQLGTLQNLNLASAGTFIPIFTCGNIQYPANDLKRVVITFCSLTNFTTPPNGAGALALGIPGTPADWAAFLIPINSTLYTQPIPPPPIGIGFSGYSPGTIFGAQVLIAMPGTCTVTAFGWGE